jgi:exodeoxyribonuclease VII large subunit
VGHEIDVTICDLVADLRAPTPSAAAELAVPARREVAARVAALAARLAGAAGRHEQRAGAALRQVRRVLVQQAVRVVERQEGRVRTLAGQLEALSPLATLNRGYAVARAPDGATLKRRGQFSDGQPFALWLQDGIVDAVATGSRPRPDGSPGSPPEVHG